MVALKCLVMGQRAAPASREHRETSLQPPANTASRASSHCSGAASNW